MASGALLAVPLLLVAGGTAGAQSWDGLDDPIGALIAALPDEAAPPGAAPGAALEQMTQVPEPTTPAERQQLEARRDALFRQLIDDPANLELMFEYANVTSALGQYDQAIGTYERMLIYNPDLPRVKLEAGALYYRVGAFDQAEEYFADVVDDPGVPREVRRRVEQYRRAIALATGQPLEVAEQAPFSGTIFLGARYQTNATSSPGVGTVVPLRFGPFELPFTLQEGEAEDDVNGFVTARAVHNLPIERGPLSTLETEGFAYGALYAEQDELNIGLLDLDTGPVLVPAGLATDGPLAEALADTAVRPFFSAEYVALDEETYYASYGGGVDLRHHFSERLFAELTFEHLERDFNDTAERPTADDRDANVDTVEAETRFTLTDRNRLETIAYYTNNDAEADEESFDEFGGRLTFTHVLPSPLAEATLPLVSLDEPWVLGLTFAGRLSDYDAPDPVIAPSIAREDAEWRLQGTGLVGLSQDWSALLQVEYRDVNSNIDLYEFDNVSVILGAIWRFP